jgi:ABC-type ATPase with predicted acetyltransferase domain
VQLIAAIWPNRRRRILSRQTLEHVEVTAERARYATVSHSTESEIPVDIGAAVSDELTKVQVAPKIQYIARQISVDDLTMKKREQHRVRGRSQAPRASITVLIRCASP